MMTERSSRAVLTAFLVLALAAPAIAADLLVVERPVEAGLTWNLMARCVSGSRLVQLGADESSVVLTPDFDGACDPSVSFDGQEILFAGRKLDTDLWQVWKMDLTTGDAIRITNHPGHAFAPIWVGSIFHLNDETPTRRIAYLATTPTYRRVPVLHTANLDGSNALRISYGNRADLAPDVLPNGRLVYPAEATNRRGFPLMSLAIDGTDLTAFADPHDKPRRQDRVRVGRDGRVYFVESTPSRPPGGELAYVELRRPLRSRTRLSTTDHGLFLDPAPMSDGTLLASHLAQDADSYKLVRVDPESGRVTGEVHNRKGFHALDAQEIAARPIVPGRSTVVDDSKETGVFFCLSSHITDRPSLAHLRDGRVSRLRVIEAMGERKRYPSDPLESVMGHAPVESDGSFHIEVPARIPLRFQLLDDEDRVIAEQHTWTWVMPREWRGCIGCHEDREMVAPNILADAVIKPAIPIGIASNDPKEGE